MAVATIPITKAIGYAILTYEDSSGKETTRMVWFVIELEDEMVDGAETE